MKPHSFQRYSHDLEMAVHDAWITTKVLPHMFTPGSFPEAPNAEESTEYPPRPSTRMDDK